MAKKLYYKIGEACKRLDIQPYVLRYWETEFPMLKPDKSSSGQRVYSERDLATIRRIKELLYDEGYTIAGAKKKLDGEDLSKLDPPEAAPAAKKAAAKKTPAKKAPAKKKAQAEKTGGDGGTAEEAAQLRKGVEKAVREARSILELLGSK